MNKQVTIRKISEHNPSPNVSIGEERTGELLQLEIGRGIIVLHSNGTKAFHTSRVQHLDRIDHGWVAKTSNSIYKITINE